MSDTTDHKLQTPDEYNARVHDWNQRLRSRIISTLMLLTNEEKQKVARKLYKSSRQKWKQGGQSTPEMEQPLIPSLKTREFQSYGETYGISQSFSLHGIYVHYGVGRGHKAGSQSMVSTGKERKPFDWLNKNVLALAPELEQIVAEYYGDKCLVNISQVLIKKNETKI